MAIKAQPRGQGEIVNNYASFTTWLTDLRLYFFPLSQGVLVANLCLPDSD
jgi:hypothetical protein